MCEMQKFKFRARLARLHSLKEFDFSYDPLYHILWEFRAGGHGNSSHNTTILVLQMPQKSILVMVFVNFTGCYALLPFR